MPFLENMGHGTAASRLPRTDARLKLWLGDRSRIFSGRWDLAPAALITINVLRPTNHTLIRLLLKRRGGEAALCNHPSRPKPAPNNLAVELSSLVVHDPAEIPA
jgi:hypothetical protein